MDLPRPNLRAGRRRLPTAGLLLGSLVPVAFAGCASPDAALKGLQPKLLMVQPPGKAAPGGFPAPAVTGARGVDSKQIDQRLLNASATTGGELEVSLAWNSLSDLDLQVRDPAGEMIMADHRRSASGGVQDVDANPTPVNEEGARRADAGLSPGRENVLPVPEMLVDMDKKLGLPEGMSGLGTLPGREGEAPSRYTRTPVEHIYFARAPRGTYIVYARCYSWCEPNFEPLPCTVQVRSRGKVFFERTGTLGPQSFVTHGLAPTEVCRFDIR
jgi:hypothetical protein